MKLNIRLLYLYLFSLVGLIISTIGAVRLVELGLKMFVFKDADRFDYYAPPILPEERIKMSTEEAQKQEQAQKDNIESETTKQRQREAAGALSMLIVGFPLYRYHWKIIQSENKRR